MQLTRNLVLQILAVLMFLLAVILGFALLGSSQPDVGKLLAVVSLGLAFHAAAHI